MAYESANSYSKITAGNPLGNTLPSNAWIELIVTYNSETSTPGLIKSGAADYIKTMLFVDASTDFYGESTLIYS